MNRVNVTLKHATVTIQQEWPVQISDAATDRHVSHQDEQSSAKKQRWNVLYVNKMRFQKTCEFLVDPNATVMDGSNAQNTNLKVDKFLEART